MLESCLHLQRVLLVVGIVLCVLLVCAILDQLLRSDLHLDGFTVVGKMVVVHRDKLVVLHRVALYEDGLFVLGLRVPL